MRWPIRLLVCAVWLPAVTGGARAQGEKAPTRNPTPGGLTLTANAVPAIALEISAPDPGVEVVRQGLGGAGEIVITYWPGQLTPATPTETGTLYLIPLTLRVRFSGFTREQATLSLSPKEFANAASRAASREGASPQSARAVSISAPNILLTDIKSGAHLTRHVGLFVSNANGASAVNGSLSSRIVYQVTVS